MVTRIVIADDHPLVRTGLKLLISTQPDLTVVGEAGNSSDTLRAVGELVPDLLLLDISMPGRDCLETIRTLRLNEPGLKILVVTMHHDRALLEAVLEAGATGVCTKTSADADLLQAISHVMSGQQHVSASEADRPASPEDDPVQLLSTREREVLRFLVRGHTNQAIADRLGVGVKSIESYRARLMTKLGIESRVELVEMAVRSGVFFESA